MLDIGRAVTTHVLREVVPLEELARRWRTARLRLLTVNVRGDAFFPLAPTRALTEVTRRAGVPHTHIEFDSDLGHLACVEETWRFETALRLLMNAEEPGEEDGHAQL